jgi:hypothetical protein
MMTRASRLLKWIGAGTVLLAAAPIAYADDARHTGSPAADATARHSSPGAGSSGPLGSGGCGAAPADFVGAFAVTGRPAEPADLPGQTLDFRADGTMSVLSSRALAATGTWHASGGGLVWTVGGVTYESLTGTAACADQVHTARVTAFAASDSLTLQRF